MSLSRVLVSALTLTHCTLHGSFLQELQNCATDDDVAMCFIKNQVAFEKYLEFLVGRVQAESAMVSTAVQEFYKVPLPACAPLPVSVLASGPGIIFPDPAWAPHGLPRPWALGLVRKAGGAPKLRADLSVIQWARMILAHRGGAMCAPGT